jgi:undecaprenyl diphosphate synthase
LSNPKNVAIIMDGNGRWAQLRGKPRTYGHIKGARVAKKIVTECASQKLESLILYTFSTENWLRPATEVGFLMGLLRRYLKRETQSLVRQNIKFTVIGDVDRLPKDILEAVRFAETSTASNTGLKLVFALSYGSRAEITSAIKEIANRVLQGELEVSQIDENLVQRALQTSTLPDPDLIIRTSGEVRLSNFLLWQSAYSELYFTKTLWPDFNAEQLALAFVDYSNRTRKFGGIAKYEDATH